MICFASDNASTVHPKIIESIVDSNIGYASPYGNDEVTKKVNSLIKELFGNKVSTFFVFNGTGANTVALDVLTEKYSMILSATSSHISEDESGAPVRFTGCPIRFINDSPKKINKDDIKNFLAKNPISIHKSTPNVLSISQCTEMGESYSLTEIFEISELCKQNKIKIHVDGARISNAVCEYSNPQQGISDILDMVDVISFGGTKNGLMFGEAILTKDQSLLNQLAHSQKQAMQLASKTRYIASQFFAFFQNGLWLELATHANKMAKKLCSLISASHTPLYSVDANIVFLKLHKNQAEKLHEEFYFYDLYSKNDHVLSRFVTSWENTYREIELLAHKLL